MPFTHTHLTKAKRNILIINKYGTVGGKELYVEKMTQSEENLFRIRIDVVYVVWHILLKASSALEWPVLQTQIFIHKAKRAKQETLELNEN